MGLSTKQQNIVDASGKVVIKACPGSGKTYSVAARIANLININKFSHNGIAAISFTNTAWQEINNKLSSEFKINTPLPYPHFVGTLDSFFNQFVFLPFGHLVMDGCCRRPEIVGEHCHNRLNYENSRRYAQKGMCVYIDPLEHFENVSFDKYNDPLRINMPQVFNFSWNNIYKKDGKYIKRLQDVIDTKIEYFKKGYANQSDANYFTLQVLKKYPLIAENIINRFPIFIIDEAQDTNDIQMEIINQLVANGLKEIMLVGDPNQAIFEWNNANPQLFIDKYEEWNKINLYENRRSSKNICDCSNTFIGNTISVPLKEGDVINFTHAPEIVEVDYDTQNIQHDIIQPFLDLCSAYGIKITNENVAILYRSKNFQKYFEEEKLDYKNLPWKAGAFYMRDIVQGKYLMEQGDLKQGFKLIEQGLLKARKGLVHIKREEIQSNIDEIGYVKYRSRIFKFIDILPTCDKTLKEWLREVHNLFSRHNIIVDVEKSKCNVSISQLFDLQRTSKFPYYHGTIHSSKGCTFEAVLLLLNKNAGNSNYSTLLIKDYSKLSVGQKEEVRNVYVAMTRPRKILQIGVPKRDISLWENKLQIKEIVTSKLEYSFINLKEY